MSTLNTIQNIADYINTRLSPPDNVSGNMFITVNLARQHVANYTGDTINPDSIADKYQPVIVDFSMADTIDMINAQKGGEKIKLDVLSIEETGEELSAKQYRLMGDMKLRVLGRKVQIVRSLS